jgi:putative endonuclease
VLEIYPYEKGDNIDRLIEKIQAFKNGSGEKKNPITIYDVLEVACAMASNLPNFEGIARERYQLIEPLTDLVVTEHQIDINVGKPPMLAPGCKLCTQTRQYCREHGKEYPDCSNANIKNVYIPIESVPAFYRILKLVHVGKMRVQYKRHLDPVFDEIERLRNELCEEMERLPDFGKPKPIINNIPEKNSKFYVYFLKCWIKHRIEYYCGYTNNLKRRFSEHEDKKVKSTKKYRLVKLVYYETYSTQKEAMRREMEIKKRTSLKKKIISQIKRNITIAGTDEFPLEGDYMKTKQLHK